MESRVGGTGGSAESNELPMGTKPVLAAAADVEQANVLPTVPPTEPAPPTLPPTGGEVVLQEGTVEDVLR